MDEGDLAGDLVSAPAAIDASLDGVPSTLPQILYLSYKNYGQFVLDCYRCRGESTGRASSTPEPYDAPDKVAEKALAPFADALRQDETDAELGRRAGRVGAALGSGRIARYCLEAVLRVKSTAGAESVAASLEEGLAGEQLTEVRGPSHGGTVTLLAPSLTESSCFTRSGTTCPCHNLPCPN